MIRLSIGAKISVIGIEMPQHTSAPIRPANSPTSAPSLLVTGVGLACCSRYAATTPPLMTQRQQHALPAETSGSADSTPITMPPMSAGCCLLVVVFTAQMGD